MCVELLEERKLLAQVTQPNPLLLSTLWTSEPYCNDGTVGALLYGTARDKFGSSVSGAGDVNGDGLDDFIVGAEAAGESYVMFGRPGRYTNVHVSMGSAGIGIDGTADSIVSSAGDVNGDGLDDIIIGAPSAASGAAAEAGQSYVIFGRAGSSHSSIDVAAFDGTDGFHIAGEHAFDHLGSSVSSAGDVNGDGFGDLVIGAPDADSNGDGSGSSYVVFGRSVFPAALDVTSLDGLNGFRVDGEAEFDRFGKSVSTAGDMNGDGIDDLVIGAPNAFSGVTTIRSGETYVLFGHAGAYLPSVQLTSIDETSGIRISGLPYDLGNLVAAAGDPNGDGFDDVIVASGGYSPSNSYFFVTYVLFGRATGYTAALNVTQLDGTNGFRVVTTDGSPNNVGSAGDVNQDGFDDVVLSIYDFAYVVYGHSGAFSAVDLALLDGAAGYRLMHSGYGGILARGAGDVNGDGFDDLVLGLPRLDSSGPGTGFVILQRAASMDFGDAPIATFAPACGLEQYDTRMISDGARHLLGSGLYLGSLVDADINGAPNATASGDDARGFPDDEDGVEFSGRLVPGRISEAVVEASLDGRLEAWIDFDRNGFDAADQIASNLAVHAGSNNVPFLVPFRSVAGTSFARFRISSAGGLEPSGEAKDGEVEDYTVEIDGVNLTVTIDRQAADGLLMTYMLTVFNRGIVDATNATVTSPLPSLMTFAWATLPENSCTESQGTVACNLGNLPVGSSKSVTLAYRPTGIGTFTYLATVTSDEPAIVFNNRATTSSDIRNVSGPDLWGTVTAYQTCKASRNGTTCRFGGTIIIQNSGSAGTPKTSGTSYISTNAIRDGRDRQVGEAKIGPIKAGGKRRIKGTVKMRPGEDLSGYYFIIVLDVAGDALEMNESNNVMYTRILDAAPARKRSAR